MTSAARRSRPGYTAAMYAGPRTRFFARVARVASVASIAVVAIGLTLPLATEVRASEYDFEWIGKIELDAEGLKSPDQKKRREAVVALGKYDIAITAPYLLSALRDRDRSVRGEAGRILGKHKVLEAAPVIIQWLEEPDAEIKQEAADILADLATGEATAALIRSLGDPDDRVRRRAAAALGKIATPRVVVPLIGRLEDDKSDVRRVAIAQLQKLGDRRAVIPLVRAFGDTNLQVRKAAITAVGYLGDPAAIPALMRLLRHSVEDIRLAAVTSLGNLHAVIATDALIDELERGPAPYSSRVAFALGQIARHAAGGTPATEPTSGRRPAGGQTTNTRAAANRAMRALVAVLAQRTLRTAASEALRHAADAAVPALLAHLEGEIDGDPTTVVELLRDIGDSRATTALIAELDRGRIKRTVILDALARSGDQRALLPILGLLTTGSDTLRLHAMNSLRPIINDLRAADVLISLLDDKNVEIRIMAAEYLGLMRSKQAVPRLIELTDPSQPLRLQQASVDALGEIADPRGAATLVALLASPRSRLHHAAASALIYIAGTRKVAESAPSIAALLRIARTDEAPARHQAIRALGGILRDRSHDEARNLFIDLAQNGPTSIALSAIEALGAMADKAAVKPLLALAQNGGKRRRSAITALGDLADKAAVPVLLESLDNNDDRVSGDAAWALGKLADPQAIDALLRATRRRGWATPINASAALARYATRAQRAEIIRLLYHRSRFVRVNAAIALGRLGPESKDALLQAARKDSSWSVRIAACRAASQIGAGAALRVIADEDRDERVRAAAEALMAAPFKPVARTDWRHFYFVDPDRDDVPVQQEPYVILTADGLASAIYTDARGIATEEQFPPGDATLTPRSTASRY